MKKATGSGKGKSPAPGKAKSPRIATPRAGAHARGASPPPVDQAAPVDVVEGFPDIDEPPLPPFKPYNKVDPRAYKPNEKDRRMISMGKALCMTEAQIATQIGISETTMKKYYREELAVGTQAINVMVANNMAQNAIQTQDRKAAVSAGKFWLESHGGPAFKSAGRVSAEAKFGIRRGGDDDPRGDETDILDRDDLEFEFTLKIGDREPKSSQDDE